MDEEADEILMRFIHLPRGAVVIVANRTAIRHRRRLGWTRCEQNNAEKP